MSCLTIIEQEDPDRIRLFLSHSEKDKELVSLFVDLLTTAISLPRKQIRCTSQDGCRLPTACHTGEQLRGELVGAEAFVAILTPASLSSDYVLFELGARWGKKEKILALLANGASPRDLKGPLKEFTARRSDEAEILQFITDISCELGCSLNGPAGYHQKLKRFHAAAIEIPIQVVRREIEPKSQELVASPTIIEPRPKPLSKEYTARDLCHEITKAPLLQQAAKVQQFIGCLVDWETTLSGANTLKNGSVSISLNPYEDEGFDTAIHCVIDGKTNPELENAQSGALYQVIGEIKQIELSGLIELHKTKLIPLQDFKGTHIRSLLHFVWQELGLGLGSGSQISNVTIQSSIRNQIQMNQIKGFSVSGNMIYPAIPMDSDILRLLILKSCNHLLETNASLGKQAKDKLFSLQNDIYRLENGAQFGA